MPGLNQDKRLNYLVVGTGMMGKILGPIIQQSGQKIIGVVDSSKEKAEEFIEENNFYGAQAFAGEEGLETALCQLAVDAVAVLVPNHLHARMLSCVLKHKKHALVEKPLAINLDEARSLLQQAVEAQTAVEIDSQYRHHELIDGYMRDVIRSQSLGRPTYIRMEYLQDWQMNPEQDIGWRPVAALAGKGKLVGDLGTHVLQTVLHLFGGGFVEFSGRTVNVFPMRYSLKSGEGGTFKKGSVTHQSHPELFNAMDMLSPEFSGDDIADARFVLKTDAGCFVPGEFTLSQVHAGRKNDFSIELVFEKGSLRWQAETPNTLIASDAAGEKTIVERSSDPGAAGRPAGHPQGYGDAILLELQEFHDVIRSGDTDRIQGYTQRNLAQAVHAMEIVAKWIQEPPVLTKR